MDHTGLVYVVEDGKPKVIVTIRFDRYLDYWAYDQVLDAYAEKYAIKREGLKLTMCACIPDPRRKA